MISATTFIRHALRILIPLSVVLTTYLYYYPIFQGCAFPLPDNVATNPKTSPFFETVRQHVPFLAPLSPDEALPAAGDTQPNSLDTPPLFPSQHAPFRLLALGDPQLEGDSSVPNSHKSSSFPHLDKMIKRLTFKTQSPNLRHRVRWALHDLIDFYFEDIPDTLESLRKRLDHVGNDLYLSLVYHTMHWWTKPTHVTVLGDLLGSQWIDNKEFTRRADRFWTRVFKGAERVPDDVAMEPDLEYDLSGFIGVRPSNESEVWERRLINVAGNHDIGYAGDLNANRLKRFEKKFGKSNYELRFEMPVSDAVAETVLTDENVDSDRLQPELRVVVLNNMNLDTPALSSELQDQTYSFVNDVIGTSTAVEYKGHFTVVLTHIPLYKPEGICVDAPFFAFFDEEQGGGVREQNQLSEDASKGFLQGIFGMSGETNSPGNGRGRPGVVLNGHDHEGCDTFHFINQTRQSEEDPSWEVKTWRKAKREQLPGALQLPGVREITVRSMMGDFGGYAGLLSAWFDEESWEWKFEYATCSVGTHNVWWFVHIVDLIAIGGIILYPIAYLIEASRSSSATTTATKKVSGYTNGKAALSHKA